MGRKDSQTAVSKISSASSSAAVTASAGKSSILKSAFSPSEFQLHLFASVIQSFDSHQVRIHDTATGRLRSQHEARPGSKITCVEWGYYGAAYREQRRSSSKKKRKRDQVHDDGAVVAYGTSSSEICMLSPTEGKIVGTLGGGHERGVKDFRFSPTDYLQGWSIGEDAKLVQWDLTTGQPIRTIPLPDPTISLLATPARHAPEILCASSTPFAITLSSSDDFRIDRFDSFKNAIHALRRSGMANSESPEYVIAADSDRYLNVYDIDQKKLVRTLVAGSGVLQVDLFNPSEETPDVLKHQVLSIVTKDGSVELFSQPFTQSHQVNGDLKSSRKNLTKKSSSTVRLVSPESKGKQIPIVAASLAGPDLVIVSADGGLDLSFQKIRWQDEGNGEMLFKGQKEVVKTRGASTLNTATLNGVKDLGQSHVDESRTVVVNGEAGGAPSSEAIEILSSEGDEEDDDDDSADEETSKVQGGEDEQLEDDDDSDEEMFDAHDGLHDREDAEMNEAEAGEPSFGDLLASKHPNEISIAATDDPSASALTLKPNQTAIPAGMSLGTVLTQALRTNDTSLLEACLHTTDVSIVKNTIQRLDSSLAGNLLAKLADRLASRPGRYGHLITWVQWICIAHGGALAAQPDVSSKIRSLYQVLTQRAKSYDNLLLLKGKLDMLDAQLTYRKQLAAQRPPRRDEQDEPGLIYIEGKDNWDSEEDDDDEEEEDDDLDEDIGRPSKRPKKVKSNLQDLIGDEDDDEDDEDDEDSEAEAAPLENGADLSSSDEEDHEDDELQRKRSNLFDDKAEVSDAEESDPDDDAASPAEDESSSATSSGDDGSDEEGADNDEEHEEDSEMDSFINDGSVDFAEDDEDEVHVEGDSDDGGEEEVEQPVPAPPRSKPKMPSDISKKSDKGKKSKLSRKN